MTTVIGILISVVGFAVGALVIVAMMLANAERKRKFFLEAMTEKYRSQLERDRIWFEEYKGDSNG